jgi:hypothetical protein
MELQSRPADGIGERVPCLVGAILWAAEWERPHLFPGLSNEFVILNETRDAKSLVQGGTYALTM